MPNGNHGSGMAPDQVVSIMRNSHKFKKDLDVLVETAVLKGQIELLDMLRDQIDKDIALEYNEHTDAMKYVIQKVRYTLRNQLDYTATTEMTRE